VTAPAAPWDLLRELAPQVLGAVVRRYGHFGLCEDAVQEALLAASVQWPRDGQPPSPRAWLITVASRRLIDQLRAESARRDSEATAALDPAAASRILCLARTRRLAMVSSVTMNARAISAVVSPASVRSVRATRASSASAGWQQVKISRSRSSVMPLSSSRSGSLGTDKAAASLSRAVSVAPPG